MVNPIKNQPVFLPANPPKKKAIKEIDLRVKKAIKKTKSNMPEKLDSSFKASLKISAKNAYLAAEQASSIARKRAFEIQQASVRAQKAAFLAQRAHMAQQSAAAKMARAAEKAKKEAERAAKKASQLHRAIKFKAYLTSTEKKKRTILVKKYIPSTKKKKNSQQK